MEVQLEDGGDELGVDLLIGILLLGECSIHVGLLF